MSFPLQSTAVGEGSFRYKPVPDWGQLPYGWRFGDVVGVATDSKGLVYVFNREEHPVCVFERDGRFLRSWGETLFTRPHGIFIGPDDSVYCTDDIDHTVRKFTTDGRLLMTLGTSGKGCDTGVIDGDYRTIRKAGPPFHRPTNLAVAPDGTLVVSDGYGNARIHRFSAEGKRFSAEGKLLHSGGAPGSGPGEFNLPHGVAVDREGRVYVADRENSRIQVFNARGEFVAQWSDVVRPMQVFIDSQGNVFVAEVGWKTAMFPWQVPPANASGGRLSIFNPEGKLLARWGGGQYPTAPGDFLAPHDVWSDPEGDLYVGEVVATALGRNSDQLSNYHPLQKFVRMKQ